MTHQFVQFKGNKEFLVVLRINSIIGIVSINREEWVDTDLASNLLDVTSVPLYETLGGEMLNLILNKTEMKTLFGSNVCLLNVLNNIKKGENTFLK